MTGTFYALEREKITLKKCYDEKQTLKMFELLANEPLKYQAAIYIALYGGLRLGDAYVKHRKNFLCKFFMSGVTDKPQNMTVHHEPLFFIEKYY